MKFVPLTLALVLTNIPNHGPTAAPLTSTAFPNGTPACTYDGTGFSSLAGLMQGRINAYIIWYNDPAHPWAETDKRYVRAWMSSLNGSPYWTSLAQYVTAQGYNPPSIYLAGECVDPETQGTFFECAASGPQLGYVVTANINQGCFLPLDPNGLYVVLPSFTDVTSDAGGCHYAVTVGVTEVNAAVVVQQPLTYGSQTVPSPTQSVLSGNTNIDWETFALGHEMAEGITNWNEGYGWHCGAVNTEIADVCTQGFLSGYTVQTANGPANWTATIDGITYGFVANELAQLNPYNCCASNGIPATGVGAACANQAACLLTIGMAGNQWQNNCVGGFCAAPTCTDGVVDGDEPDVDCGGSCNDTLGSIVHFCASGKKCRTGADCSSSVCTAGICN